MTTIKPDIQLQHGTVAGEDPAADVFSGARAAEAEPDSSEAMLAMVDDTVDTLLRRGITAEDLAPLRRLRRAVARLDTAAHQHTKPAAESHAALQPSPGEGRGAGAKEMRSGESMAPSDLLARTGAVIELLIQGGYTAEMAAQTVARQLLASDIHMPEGGDARGWKRLLLWHSRLVHARKRGPDYEEYLRFKAELHDIPPELRIKAVLSGRLWDRRRLQEFVRRQA